MLNWISSDNLICCHKQRTYLITDTQYKASKYFMSLGDIPAIKQIFYWSTNRLEDVLITLLLCKMLIAPTILFCFGLVGDNKYSRCMVTDCDKYLIFICWISYSLHFVLGQLCFESKLLSFLSGIFEHVLSVT